MLRARMGSQRMKGNDAVIAKLNEALREELTAINQYFVHAEMCHNWGYHRLGNYIKKQSIGEMKHAEEILERILFLDGIPSMQPLPLTIGSGVKGQLESDLKLELKPTGLYNEAVRPARAPGGHGSADLFERLLKDEEEHVDFLEAQMHQIGQLGYERYLGQQLDGGEDKSRATNGPQRHRAHRVFLLNEEEDAPCPRCLCGYVRVYWTVMLPWSPATS